MHVLFTFLLSSLVVLCGTLTASQGQTMLTYPFDKISERRFQGYLYDKRMKRSLITLGLSAARSLLDGAKFLYSNGFDTVYVKRGGIGKALKDFDSVVDDKHVTFYRKSDNTLFYYEPKQNQGQGLVDPRGWLGAAMVLGKLPVPERTTIWITVGQGSTALAVKKVGNIGDVTIIVNNESGTATMTISKSINRFLMGSADPKTVDSVIVYKGR